MEQSNLQDRKNKTSLDSEIKREKHIKQILDAQKKLYPILKEIIESKFTLSKEGQKRFKNECKVSSEQFQDILWASNTLNNIQYKKQFTIPKPDLIINNVLVDHNRRKSKMENVVVIDEDTILELFRLYDQMGIVIQRMMHEGKKLDENTPLPKSVHELMETENENLPHIVSSEDLNPYKSFSRRISHTAEESEDLEPYKSFSRRISNSPSSRFTDPEESQILEPRKSFSRRISHSPSNRFTHSEDQEPYKSFSRRISQRTSSRLMDPEESPEDLEPRRSFSRRISDSPSSRFSHSEEIPEDLEPRKSFSRRISHSPSTRFSHSEESPENLEPRKSFSRRISHTPSTRIIPPEESPSVFIKIQCVDKHGNQIGNDQGPVVPKVCKKCSTPHYHLQLGSEPITLKVDQDQIAGGTAYCINMGTDEDDDVKIVIKQCPDCFSTVVGSSSKIQDVIGESHESIILHGKGLSQHSFEDEISVLDDSLLQQRQSEQRSKMGVVLDADDITRSSITVEEDTTMPRHSMSPHFSDNDEIFPLPASKSKSVIPLTRQKICSSMEFDVSTVDSKLRDHEIEHHNPLIVLELKKLGVNQMLRACRPAKCCRKAILDERQKTALPYCISLRSLPLVSDDIQVIEQSIDMSVKKIKNSLDLTENYQKKFAYYVDLGRDEFRSNINFPWVIPVCDLKLDQPPKINKEQKVNYKKKNDRKDKYYYLKEITTKKDLSFNTRNSFKYLLLKNKVNCSVSSTEFVSHKIKGTKQKKILRKFRDDSLDGISKSTKCEGLLDPSLKKKKLHLMNSMIKKIELFGNQNKPVLECGDYCEEPVDKNKDSILKKLNGDQKMVPGSRSTLCEHLSEEFLCTTGTTTFVLKRRLRMKKFPIPKNEKLGFENIKELDEKMPLEKNMEYFVKLEKNNIVWNPLPLETYYNYDSKKDDTKKEDKTETASISNRSGKSPTSLTKRYSKEGHFISPPAPDSQSTISELILSQMGVTNTPNQLKTPQPNRQVTISEIPIANKAMLSTTLKKLQEEEKSDEDWWAPLQISATSLPSLAETVKEKEVHQSKVNVNFQQEIKKVKKEKSSTKMNDCSSYKHKETNNASTCKPGCARVDIIKRKKKTLEVQSTVNPCTKEICEIYKNRKLHSNNNAVISKNDTCKVKPKEDIEIFINKKKVCVFTNKHCKKSS